MRFTFAVSLALLFLAAPTRAEDTPPYVVGDLIDAIALEDQRGDPGAVDASTRVVLFSRDMDGGDLLKEALAEVSADTLATRGAVYVSDISGMPAFVARMMAVPAMRRRPYDMLLDREGDVTARLPDAEGENLVLDVLLLAAPVTNNPSRWERIGKRVVAGRLINAYVPDDTQLGVLYRLDHLASKGCCGLAPVASERVESYDATEQVAHGSRSYHFALPAVCDAVGLLPI